MQACGTRKRSGGARVIGAEPRKGKWPRPLQKIYTNGNIYTKYTRDETHTEVLILKTLNRCDCVKRTCRPKYLNFREKWGMYPLQEKDGPSFPAFRLYNSRDSVYRSQRDYWHEIGQIVAFLFVADTGQFRVHIVTCGSGVNVAFCRRVEAVFVAELALPTSAASVVRVRHRCCNEQDKQSAVSAEKPRVVVLHPTGNVLWCLQFLQVTEGSATI